MQKVNYWYVPLVGLICILLGAFVLQKADKWVMLLVENWPFKKFTIFEIKLMKIGWKIVAGILIAFGGWIFIKHWLL